MFDIRLKENFKLFVSGPSRCGKTFFISELLENIDTFSKDPPETILYTRPRSKMIGLVMFGPKT